MMLRSHCRSTPDLIPNYYDHNHQLKQLPNRVMWFTMFAICLASQAILYVQYILPMKEQIGETIKYTAQLKREHDNCLKRTEHLIKKEISLYDADKTNLTDYALESSGGTIVSTRCTDSYLEKNIQYSVDGLIPVFFTSNSPRVVIQPNVIPGECWSFAGSEGVLVVQLSRTIIPTSFTSTLR